VPCNKRERTKKTRLLKKRRRKEKEKKILRNIPVFSGEGKKECEKIIQRGDLVGETNATGGHGGGVGDGMVHKGTGISQKTGHRALESGGGLS